MVNCFAFTMKCHSFRKGSANPSDERYLCIYMQGHMHWSFSIGSFKEITDMHSLFNYIDQCQSRLIINSHGFIQHQVYSYRYARSSSG
jgi:hypothetical protein